MQPSNNNQIEQSLMRLRVKIPLQFTQRKFMVAVKRDWTIWKVANRALAVYKQLFYNELRSNKFSKDLTVKSLLIDGYYMSKNQLVGNLLDCDDEIVCEIINTKSLFSQQQKQLIQKPIKRPSTSIFSEIVKKQIIFVKKESQNRSEQKQNKSDQKQDQNQNSQSDKIIQSIFVREDMKARFNEQNIEKMRNKKERMKQKRKQKFLAKKNKKTQQNDNKDLDQQNKGDKNIQHKVNQDKVQGENMQQQKLNENLHERENIANFDQKQQIQQENKMIPQQQIAKNTNQNIISISSKTELSNSKIDKIRSKQRQEQYDQKIKKNKPVRDKSSQDLRIGRDHSESKSDDKFKLNIIGPVASPYMGPNLKTFSPKISSPKITFYKQTPKQDAKSPSSFIPPRKISQQFSLNRRQQLVVPLNLDGEAKQKAKSNECVKVKSKQKVENIQKIPQQINKLKNSGAKKRKVVVQEVSSDDDAKASPTNIKQSHTNESSELPDNPNFYPKFKQMKDIEQHMKKYQIQLSDSEQQ